MKSTKNLDFLYEGNRASCKRIAENNPRPKLGGSGRVKLTLN